MMQLQLPKTKVNPEDTKGFCKCRPICKSRRREWKGAILKPSAEVLIERKPVSDCIRRWPQEVQFNGPCPLFEKTKPVFIKRGYVAKEQHVVRICPGPIDDFVPTPYLRAAEIAKKNGALDLVQACCPFCVCGKCCPCGIRNYIINDPDRDLKRRDDMRNFDTRVKKTYQEVRAMYNWTSQEIEKI